MNSLQTLIFFLCYDCHRQTKRKLEDKNKINIFYVCFASLSEKWKNKETENIFCYGCII